MPPDVTSRVSLSSKVPCQGAGVKGRRDREPVH